MDIYPGYDKTCDQSAAVLDGGLDDIVIVSDGDVIAAEYENI